MIPTKIYRFTVPANGMYSLLVQGSFFKVLSSTAPVLVRSDKVGTIGELLPGQGMERAEFSTLQFTDTSGFANEVRVLVAGDLFIDDRISGEVSVIDGGKYRTIAGMAFAGYMSSQAVAARYPAVQIWNPAGSGKNICLEKAVFTSGVAGSVYAGINSVQLANVGTPLSSKKSGGPAGVAVHREESLVAMPTFGQVQVSVSVAAVQPYTWQLIEPVVITPGYGFVAAVLAQNSLFQMSVEFFEEAL